MSSERYYSLDLLRAVMMFLGIVLHGAQMYMAIFTTDDYYLDPNRSVSMDVMLAIINTFRMPVFFFLSGFFVAMLYQRRGLTGMLRNRLSRITLPSIVLILPVGLSMGALTILGSNWLNTHAIGWSLAYIDNPFKLVDKTHNLWFLYYLTFHFLTASLLICFVERYPKKFFTGIRWHGWAFVLALSLVLALSGSLSPNGRIQASVVFMPALDVYLYFGACFWFGWLLYDSNHLIDQFEQRAWRLMGGAWLTLIVAVVCFALKGQQPDFAGLLHVGLSLFSGLSVALFIAAFVGIFQRYFNVPNDAFRYFSDSAYWVFVSHSFFLVALAIPMAHLNWVAEVKFSIVVAGATWLSLLTYKHWVRPTWLGGLLNGKVIPRDARSIRDR